VSEYTVPITNLRFDKGVVVTIFEYDVFLSFASSDEEIVKPIWQELSVSGLRVFWSDSALKKELGDSWFQAIESSLEKSRHMLLICSPSSMSSRWVQREYRAFLNHCHRPGVRRLIPLLVRDYNFNDLPLFLRELQTRKLGELDTLREIITVLGGVSIEELRNENESLRQKMELLQQSRLALEQEIRELKDKGQSEEIAGSELENKTEGLELGIDDVSQRRLRAFEFLGIPFDAKSQDISQRYLKLKGEYQSLLHNCPEGLREVCAQRLELLEEAFSRVFPERQKEEDDQIERAFNLLQVPKGTIDRSTFVRRYREMTAVCFDAMKSSDQFIRDAATNELKNLQDAFLTLAPTQPLTSDEVKRDGIVEVVMPQMGESIAEGTLTKWLKNEGETIDRDEPLFEISTDKVDAEIPSPSRGILIDILVMEGETVEVNTVVALIATTPVGELGKPLEDKW
jgi:biotin carboxyl carrier protein/FtsZ-binding cell division protein ZapB